MNRLPPTLRSTIARATNNPVRAGFLWSAGTHLADLAFGLLRLIMMLALLAALAGAAYYALQKAPDNQKPPAASKPTEKAENAARAYTSAARERLTQPDNAKR